MGGLKLKIQATLVSGGLMQGYDIEIQSLAPQVAHAVTAAADPYLCRSRSSPIRGCGLRQTGCGVEKGKAVT